jgi:uncharacterized lipoprotein YajG
MKTQFIKASLIAAALVLISGCATTEQIEAIRATADRALSAANNAQSTADRALSAANSASDSARDARSAADAAMACCNDNSTKIDRMFEEAMQK